MKIKNKIFNVITAYPKLTIILTGIAIAAAAAISAVSGLQYAHAGSPPANSCSEKGLDESCNASGVAPGHGGLIPGLQGYGPPRDETPHQCEIGICQ